MYFREFVGIILSILYVIIQIFTATFFRWYLTTTTTTTTTTILLRNTDSLRRFYLFLC